MKHNVFKNMIEELETLKERSDSVFDGLDLRCFVGNKNKLKLILKTMDCIEDRIKFSIFFNNFGLFVAC